MDMKDKRRIFLTFLYIMVFISAFFGGFVFFDRFLMPKLTRRGKEKTLPNVVGLEFDSAASTLERYGYKPVKVEQEYSNDIPEGHILWQRPEGGSIVKPGRKVMLCVSLGAEKIVVPNLRGVSYRQGIISLEKLGLTVGKIEYKYSDSITVDNIIATFPPAFSSLKKKDTVNLVVSLGVITGKVFVPSFVGYPVTGLLERVRNAGLYADSTCITVRKIPTMKPGIVFQQSLYPGEQVPRNTRIEFIVNEGEPENE